MALLTRELYHSSNGDRWRLARDPYTGQVFVRHQANLPSDGHVADIGVAVFLSQGKGPEHQELLRLIGTLVDETADGEKTGAAALLRQNGGAVLYEAGTGFAHSACGAGRSRSCGAGNAVNIERVLPR
jgi:hypothetical protein